MIHRGSIGEHALVRAGFQELADPQPARVTRRLLSGQSVVGTDHLVAEGDVGASPEEQRAVVRHVPEEVVRIAGHDLHVLGGNVVGHPDHLRVVLAHDHLAVVGPGLRRNRSGRQDGEQALDLDQGLAGKRVGGGQ